MPTGNAYLHVLQHDPAATLILIFHQLLSVLTFLLRLFLEELGEVF